MSQVGGGAKEKKGIHVKIILYHYYRNVEYPKSCYIPKTSFRHCKYGIKHVRSVRSLVKICRLIHGLAGS